RWHRGGRCLGGGMDASLRVDADAELSCARSTIDSGIFGAGHVADSDALATCRAEFSEPLGRLPSRARRCDVLALVAPKLVHRLHFGGDEFFRDGGIVVESAPYVDTEIGGSPAEFFSRTEDLLACITESTGGTEDSKPSVTVFCSASDGAVAFSAHDDGDG